MYHNVICNYSAWFQGLVHSALFDGQCCFGSSVCGDEFVIFLPPDFRSFHPWSCGTFQDEEDGDEDDEDEDSNGQVEVVEEASEAEEAEDESEESEEQAALSSIGDARHFVQILDIIIIFIWG